MTAAQKWATEALARVAAPDPRVLVIPAKSEEKS